MMYKVISKYNKKGRSARISGGWPAFNIQQDHTLPVMAFLFFSQFLRVGVDIHPATVFLGMQPFPLFEHNKRNTRRDDRNQHDQSGHETHIHGFFYKCAEFCNGMTSPYPKCHRYWNLISTIM